MSSKLYKDVLALVEALIELDPPEGSPEGNLLKNLATVVAEYEKATYPDLANIKPHPYSGEGMERVTNGNHQVEE